MYTNKSLEILIKRQVKDIIEKTNLLFPNHTINYEDIKYKFNLRGTTGGKSCYGTMTLYFNLILANENLITYYNEVIPHEIAHLYQRKIYPHSKSHGMEWKMIFSKMGYTPNRCHSMNTDSIKAARKPKIKYLYTCPCGKIFHMSKLLHDKMNSGKQIRSCKLCKGKIFFMGLTKVMK